QGGGGAGAGGDIGHRPRLFGIEALCGSAGLRIATVRLADTPLPGSAFDRQRQRPDPPLAALAGRDPELAEPAFPGERFVHACSRRGTMMTASPVTTSLPPTLQAVSNSTMFFSGLSPVTLTRAVTVSPMNTGARNRRFWLT